MTPRNSLCRPLSICLLLCLALLMPATGATAQAADSTAAPAADFERAAAGVAEKLERARTEQRELAALAAAELDDMQARLARLKADIAAENAARTRAAESLRAEHDRRAELSLELARAKGDLEILIGHVRASARDLLSLARTSPLTAEHPERLALLESYLDKARYPGLEEINDLIDQFFLQIEGDRLIETRSAALVDETGEERRAGLVRLGGLCTVYSLDGRTGYAAPSPTSGRLLAVAGDPGWLIRRNIRAFMAGEDDHLYLDVSGGAALGMLSGRSGPWNHLMSGGPIVWPILAVGLLALVLILERMIFLGRVRTNTDQLMDQVNDLVAGGDFQGAFEAAESQPGRPTSNVIKAGLELRRRSAEAIESGLSEAMLKELPRLERFLTILKVLAAVAPLLGLLGTVTGMINTFHVITTFGAGEPRLMAGGISEALVTTQLGLAVAIPIMVAAALLSRKAQRITGDMEEKAVALSAALIDRRATTDREAEVEA